MQDQTLLCTFRVGPMKLGIDVHEVQEVIREQQMTRVPGSHDLVQGLMNLRGRIVTALDLSKRLGIPEDPRHRALTNVVVRTDENPVSLLVHEIGDVVTVTSDSFEPPPETLLGVPRELIRGAWKLNDGLLLGLNTQAVLQIAA